MRNVTYSLSVSLDGHIVGPDGGFDWTAPDEDVFRCWIDDIRQVGVHLLGRRLYEAMLYWETADQDPSLDDSQLGWTALRKALRSSPGTSAGWISNSSKPAPSTRKSSTSATACDARPADSRSARVSLPN